jgi:ATP-dependent DNA helicase DinG
VLDEMPSGLEDDLAQLAQVGQLLRLLYRDTKFLTSDPDEDWVTWIDPAPRQGLRRLGASLLEAGEVLRNYWLDGDWAPIMTSATLAVGEDFTHMLGELGLTRRRPAAVTFACPSPFDYHRQIRILVPGRFPAPSAPDFSQAVGEVMAQLGRHIPRKTLGLFTSFRMIGEVEQVMERAGMAIGGTTVHSGGTPVFSQHPGVSPAHLMERFRQSGRAVLLGTSTFWEGVDFPGEDLEILVVAKLPFLVPNDPWVEARCERLAAMGENPFTAFMVRDAVLRLRQGIGRLIRRVQDKGVVLILDNRLHTKNYGVTFLSALPVVPETFRDSGDLLDRLEDFFNQP